MGDVYSAQRRSEIMSKIRSKNSQAELTAFKHLRKEKIHFQKHYKHGKLGINIDIARPRDKKAVFIDGDFWHGRNYEDTIQKLPDDGYWREKIKRNVERDQENKEQLENSGWKILRIWESDIKRKSTREKELEKIAAFLAPDKR